MNNVSAPWKYTEWLASSRSIGFQKNFFQTIYTFKHTIEQCMRSVKVHWVVGFKRKQWLAEEDFETLYTCKHTTEQSMRSVEVHWLFGFKQKHWLSEELLPYITHIQSYNWTMYALCESKLNGGIQAEAMACRISFSKLYTHSNIQLNNVCALRKYSEWWHSSRSNGFQKKFFKTYYIFKHTIEHCMRSVKVHWVVGFEQKQWNSEEVFHNIKHIQACNWTMYVLCKSTLSGGIQPEAMARSSSFLKHYTHSKLQLNRICALWKYSEWWASSRINGFQKKFFKTLNIFKHTTEQCMRSVKVHWVVGFKQEQWLSEECFLNIIHMQTYNWTKYALCECTLSGGLQTEAMAFRNFSKHYTHSNIQLSKVCAMWKYTEWWASSRSIGFQKKFFKTLYTFQHTIEQCMRSVKYTECLASSRSNGFQKNFSHTLYTLKPQIEQNMRSVKVQWVLGFRHKQWLSEEIFWNIIHIQTCNWTKYALCESTLSSGLQAEAKAFWRSFLKHYTHSNIQLNKVCALWKYSGWWASSRSNGIQKKIFKTLNIFKHAIEQGMCSVIVHLVVGFNQKQWLAEVVFWNIIHIQKYNWTKYALCESTLSVWLQAEAMAFRRTSPTHYTHWNLKLNKICALWKYSECWASGTSNGFLKKFFETLYTFKHAIEQSMRSVKVHWAVGFRQKQRLSEEVFWSIIHIQTYNWTKYALCESTVGGGLQAEAMEFRRKFSKH